MGRAFTKGIEANWRRQALTKARETQDMAQSTDSWDEIGRDGIEADNAATGRPAGTDVVAKPVNLQRVANLQATFTKYGLPHPGAGWEAPDDSDIERFVAIETSPDGPWYKFADTAQGALDSFYTDEGDWMAEAVVDLDNGYVHHVATKATLTGSYDRLLDDTQREIEAACRPLRSYSDALTEAKGLMSEGGENPEYDRALTEILARLWPVDDMDTSDRASHVADDMGVTYQNDIFTESLNGFTMTYNLPRPGQIIIRPTAPTCTGGVTVYTHPGQADRTARIIIEHQGDTCPVHEAGAE